MAAQWTFEATNELRRLWMEERLTASEAARKLSEFLGCPVTRNAIIGKVDRLGLVRELTVRKIPREARKRPLPRGLINLHKARNRPHLVWSQPEKPGGLSVSFLDLRAGQCRYIVGEIRGLETPFCGEPSGEQSFCAYHHEICHLGKNWRAAKPVAVSA